MSQPIRAAADMGPMANDHGATERISSAPHPVAVIRFPRRSNLLLATLDCVAVVAGYSAADLVFRGDIASSPFWPDLLDFFVAAMTAHVMCLHLFSLHRRMWRHAGIQDALDIVTSSTTAVAILSTLHAAHVAPARQQGLSTILFGGMLATWTIGVFRFRSRLTLWNRRPQPGGLRVAVIGCRDAGASAVRDMLNNPGAGLVPVAIFDDDDTAHGLALLGVPVVGPVSLLPMVRAKFGIELVMLAIPSPSTRLVHESSQAADAAGLTLRLLPGMRDLLGPAPAPRVLPPREFRIEDLLGREHLVDDLDAIAESLVSHRVLITGAGGSIGSEISRQVAQFDPELIILLDRDETHLHDAASSLSGPYRQELVDIRDPDAVFDVLDRYRPSIVFHAAAHKHVPILETHPIEASKTNVFGTLNVVEAAAAFGVSRFVMISTDKAVRPTSVMGAAKLIGERILLAQESTSTTFCAVRFGNVLGSRGSVIPTFSRQIAAGGPVTVTDPLMTRFFMSLQEAVQLVLHASHLATGGDIFMLEMGEPVSILDLAQRMIRLSGYDVDNEIGINFVGGRPGEKLVEELCSPDEEITATSHPSILRLVPPAIDADAIAKGILKLHEAVSLRDGEGVRTQLFALARPIAVPVRV